MEDDPPVCIRKQVKAFPLVYYWVLDRCDFFLTALFLTRLYSPLIFTIFLNPNMFLHYRPRSILSPGSELKIHPWSQESDHKQNSSRLAWFHFSSEMLLLSLQFILPLKMYLKCPWTCYCAPWKLYRWIHWSLNIQVTTKTVLMYGR